MVRLKQNIKSNIKKVSELKVGEFFKFNNSKNTINYECDHIFIKVEEVYDKEDIDYCYDLTTNKVFPLNDDCNSEIVLLEQINELEFKEI